jgi:predicted neuraminidase
MHFRTEPVFTENSEHPSCHASTLEELPDGTLLCAWYAGSYEKHPNVVIQLSRKPVGAKKSWEEPVVIQDTPGFSEGNPVLYYSEDGVLWLFYVTMYGNRWDECRLKYRRSADEGQTWGEEVTFQDPSQPKLWPYRLSDGQRAVNADGKGSMTKNKPIRYGDRILLPLYDERNWMSYVLYSEDNGETWNASNYVTSSPGNLQPTLMPLRDGRIFMLLRTTGDSRVNWRTYSSDGGLTWSDPAEPADLPNPHSGTDGVTLQSGNLAFTYNPSPSARTPLAVALSEDDGETWPFQQVLETENAEFSYPVIFQGRDGRIHLSYTHKRTRIQYAEFDEEWLKTARL